ncbi:MAG: HepT-like ribonuclease domain-containing protein [Desulfobacterales bacterium]
MLPHDNIRLRHMLDSALEAVKFADGKSREDLDNDRKLVLAIMKSIEIIGEAASKVSENCQAENDKIPWRDIIGMRNRMIHGYFEVNHDIVWETVQTDIPRLIEVLSNIIPKEES